MGSRPCLGILWKLGHSDNFDILADGLQNSEQVIFWSVDPNTSAVGYYGQDKTIWRQWLHELGIQSVFIDPYCNSTVRMSAKNGLLPARARMLRMAEAIAYVWTKEGTYDKWFIENRNVGFEECKAHILGETDGQPRTPQWAAKICDVPAHTITALAREWASKKTMLACGAMYGTGGACREAYATEWARLMVILIAMQGIGKPGVNIWGGVAMGAPLDFNFKMPGYASAGWDAFATVAKKPAFPNDNKVTQKVYRILLPEAILNPPIHWRGEGFCGVYFDQNLKAMTYPEPGTAPR